MNIKKLIAQKINYKIDDPSFGGFENMVIPVQANLEGDFCVPCFSLAKILRKSPQVIASEIKESCDISGIIERAEVVGGYLNFFLNRAHFNEQVLLEAADDKFFEDKDSVGKTMYIDYSSVNLAKYMHIGHLSTTMIGESISRIYEAKGYKVIRANYIGDYGTPFGKMIYAYLNWGNESELNSRGVDYLQELYVEFYKKSESDPTLDEKCREIFKLIELKDQKIYPIYQRFIEISKIEAKELLDKLDVHFDTWKGESAYSDCLGEIVDELESKNMLKVSDGAKIVDLSDYGYGVCLIQKSDGTSLYATRDIAAAIDRYNTYKFDKMIYVTAVQQKLHFEQFFKVLDLLGYDFAKNLLHVYYGMFSLPDGKIASRRGKQAVLKDLIEFAENKTKAIIENREFSFVKKEDVIKAISMSALKFNALKNERIKDSVFDADNCFNFDGDTSVYLQYTYARICSVLRKMGNVDAKSFDIKYLESPYVFEITKMINDFSKTLNMAFAQHEPSIISKYTIDLCKVFNKFYTTEKFITLDQNETASKAYLLNIIKSTLAHAFKLICIDTIEEM